MTRLLLLALLAPFEAAARLWRAAGRGEETAAAMEGASTGRKAAPGAGVDRREVSGASVEPDANQIAPFGWPRSR
jgi:hypothetical protein